MPSAITFLDGRLMHQSITMRRQGDK